MKEGETGLDMLGESCCLVFLEGGEEPFFFGEAIGRSANVDCVAAYDD